MAAAGGLAPVNQATQPSPKTPAGEDPGPAHRTHRKQDITETTYTCSSDGSAGYTPDSQHPLSSASTSTWSSFPSAPSSSCTPNNQHHRPPPPLLPRPLSLPSSSLPFMPPSTGQTVRRFGCVFVVFVFNYRTRLAAYLSFYLLLLLYFCCVPNCVCVLVLLPL